jgi:zinc transporter
VSLRLWVNGSRIVSIGRRKSRAIAELDERIHQNRGPRRTGEFVALLVGLLNDGIEPAIRELEDLTDDIEDRSLDLVAAPGAAMRNEIALVRKQSILFRRHISPQRDALSRLQNARLPWLKEEDDKWQMQDNLDRAARYIEDLDTIRERTQIVQDEVASSMTARLNKNIYILSMITVIFMPLTFLTGLLGINVQGIPGAHSALAFLIVCLLLAGMAIGEVLLFRRLKWL